MSKNHYKEIQGRYLYILQEDGEKTATLTAGTPEDHTHVDLNLKQAKALHKWLEKYIERRTYE